MPCDAQHLIIALCFLDRVSIQHSVSRWRTARSQRSDIADPWGLEPSLRSSAASVVPVPWAEETQQALVTLHVRLSLLEVAAGDGGLSPD